MGLLKDIGITKGITETGKIFESLFGGKTFADIEYDQPSDYVNMYWGKFNEISKNYDRSIKGKIFELILSTLFVREGLLPMYLQANVAFVPNVNYDCLFYCDEFGPISISMKTSLRERYKQADLEAIALKYVHRKSKCYLLTMNKEEANSAASKIKSGSIIGLDEIVVCSTSQIDDLISKIKKIELKEAGNVDVISSDLIITEKNTRRILHYE
jgi:hypothetical protein